MALQQELSWKLSGHFRIEALNLTPIWSKPNLPTNVVSPIYYS